MTPISRQKQN